MDERADGIILRLRPLSDTSLVVHWLTPQFGRIATVARGARRPKSPLAGRLDLFVEARLSFRRNRRSDLHTLSEVEPVARHPLLASDLDRLEVAAYAVSLIELVTEPEAPVPELAALMADLLAYLDRHPASPRAVYAFELRLLASQGLEPDLTDSDLDPETRRLVAELVDEPWEELPGLRPSAATVQSLRRFLHGFLVFHLGRLPKGRTEALRKDG